MMRDLKEMVEGIIGDYNPKDEKSIDFFKIVQNKLHYATHGHTASEVIYERADSEKPFMGLTTFNIK